MIFEGEVGALPKIPKVYLGVAVYPTGLIRGILGNTMKNSRVDFYEWKFILIISYLLKGESQLHV